MSKKLLLVCLSVVFVFTSCSQDTVQTSNSKRYFIEAESLGEMQRYPYHNEWNNGWYAREFSCRACPAPGMGWAAVIHNSAAPQKRRISGKVKQDIPAGKYKVFVRVLHSVKKDMTPEIKLTLGRKSLNYSWGKSKRFKWLAGKVLTLDAPVKDISIEAVKFGSPTIGILYNPLKPMVCVDTVYITSDLSEKTPPSGVNEVMVKAGQPIRPLPARKDYSADDVSVYKVNNPAPKAEPFIKPVLLKSFDGRKNLWPNGSLELGMNDGWAADSTKGRHVFTDKDLDNNRPFAGSYSLAVKGKVAAFSRPYYLSRGGMSAFSLCVRSEGAVTAELRKVNNPQYKPGRPFAFEKNLVTALKLESSGSKNWERLSGTGSLTPGWYYLYVLGKQNYNIDGIQLEYGRQSTPFQPRAVVEGALRSGQLANIIYKDSQKNIDAWFHNSSGKTVNTALSYRIVDHREAVVAQGETEKVKLKSGETRKIKVPYPDKSGIFSILYAVAGRQLAEGETVYVAMNTPSKKATRHQLGANMSFAEDELMVHARAGFKWALTCKTRNIVEKRYKADGTFNYRDDLAALPAKYGLGLISNFWPTKSFKGMTKPITGVKRTLRGGFRKEMPQLDKWQDLIAKAVTHYKPYVNIWCIEDEMEFSGWNPEAILPLLQSAVKTAKGAEPDIKLGLSGDPEYIEELFALGLKPDSVDFFGASQFDFTSWRSDKTRYLQERYGKKTISYGVGGRPPADTMYHTGYAYRPMGGKMLLSVKAIIKYCLVQDIFIPGHYASIFRNDGVHKNTNKPMFDYDATPLPWGASFFVIGSNLADAVPGEMFNLGRTNRLVYPFRMDNAEWTSTWSMSRGFDDIHWKDGWRNLKNVLLPCKRGSLQVFDLFHNEIKDLNWSGKGLTI
ncbi:MAG: hypothetical protein ACYTFY_09485, partial [Planctomycetota bacterium]